MPPADHLIALLLAGLTAATRIPLRARLLPTWDAVQFALALSEYDVVKHQPHPPGYILYVALARGAEVLLGDATEALTWLAIAASVTTVVLTYRLAWALYGRATAVLATAGLAASPLFWFYGLVGLSYAVEAALATVVAWLVWRMRTGDARFVVWSGLALGAAGGVRQSILIVLLPLWASMAWLGLRRRRPVASGAVLVALTSALWWVPMVWLAGGPGAYLGAAQELFESSVRATTLLGPPGAWRVNAVALGEAATLGLGLALPALFGVVAQGLHRWPRWDARAWFLAAWILPAVAVYAWGHFGQYGYLLTVLPALYVLSARWLVAIANWGATPALRWTLAAAALSVVLAHTLFFAAAPSLDVPQPTNDPAEVARWQASLRARYRYGIWATTLGGLREQERVIQTYVDAVRQRFDAADSVLVTELGNPRSYPWLRHVGYYLPEYTVYQLRLGRFSPGYFASQPAWSMAALGGVEIFLPASVRRVVWVVDSWNPTVPRPPGLVEHPLAYGRWLYVLDVARRPVEHAGYRLTPLTAVARVR